MAAAVATAEKEESSSDDDDDGLPEAAPAPGILSSGNFNKLLLPLFPR